ncbi:2-dehydro-3-deoxygluconokinase [Halobacillus andaensis]|uniref:2-dehydro-3-deoxygluconokinase n=1 Tax=Halobacillus andaensis TaxID=1176239 RepID=A0A917B516_HALAA|nr:sugar kinase [Halobacillus andaensis]MBP2006036.1 2-dehydro-3-deoxygluconokinase [Halobacillus andaensis]GGF24106.1 2-dehydro-3-deoxygluconokinase [Halobacillus andaensis]
MGNYADVVTIGESMVLFQPYNGGGIKYAPLISKSVGGAESNLAFGLSRLGKRVRWISRVGNDPFGELILSTLAGEEIDVSHTEKDPNEATALYFKEAKTPGDPSVYYYRRHSAASQFSKEHIQPEWFEQARHLHVTGITPALGENTVEFMKVAMQQAREQGLTISFDPNLRRKLWDDQTAREVLLELIPLCDIFLPGLEEAEFLLGEQSVTSYGAAFLKMGPAVVAMKLGEQGSVGFMKNGVFEEEAYKVSQVVDTVGAGDAYAAGFLSALLDEDHYLSENTLAEALPKALKRANVTGALATQFHGDWEGAPTLDEVNHLMNDHQVITR